MALHLAPSVSFLQKTLNGAINASQTTITLSSTTNLQAPGTILIDRVDSAGNALSASLRELVYFSSINGNDITGCIRGYDGTTAQAHSDGAVCETTITAQHYASLTTVIAAFADTNGYIRPIPSPASISRGDFIQIDVTSLASIARAQITQEAITSIASITRAEVTQAALSSIASIAQLALGKIQGWDGWTTATDTWTYASAASFTIAGVDRTSLFPKGTLVKFTNNSTTYYGVVESSSFSTNTTVNLIANTDFAIANSAITNPFYAYSWAQGFPAWINFSTTATPGGSMTHTSVTTTFSRFRPLGLGIIQVQYSSVGTTGGSASNVFTFSLPATLTVVAGVGRYNNSTSEYPFTLNSGPTLSIPGPGTSMTGTRTPATSNFDLAAATGIGYTVTAAL